MLMTKSGTCFVRRSDWCLKTSTLMDKTLVLRFMEVQILLLAPICPHYAEHFWGLFGKSGSVLKASWPQTGEVDGWMSRSFQFLSKTLKAFRITAQKVRPCGGDARFYAASSRLLLACFCGSG